MSDSWQLHFDYQRKPAVFFVMELFNRNRNHVHVGIPSSYRNTREVWEDSKMLWKHLPVSSCSHSNFSVLLVACEQAHLWVTRASDEEQSDPSGEECGFSRYVARACASILACASTWACLQAILLVNFHSCFYLTIRLWTDYDECTTRISYHA